MLSLQQLAPARSRGTSLIEVLVTLVILAFGLLGVAGLQTKIGVAEMESYQRAQALLALSQMTERMSASTAQAANYVTAGPEWSNALKGAAEQRSGANAGGMQGALGCVTQLQAPNPAPGVCTAGVYQVSVAWQGMVATATPALACGTGAYGANDAFRRVIAATVSVGTTSCF